MQSSSLIQKNIRNDLRSLNNIYLFLNLLYFRSSHSEKILNNHFLEILRNGGYSHHQQNFMYPFDIEEIFGSEIV